MTQVYQSLSYPLETKTKQLIYSTKKLYQEVMDHKIKKMHIMFENHPNYI